jgi:UTP--glucose-1-phosphate uridylyltransferase
MSAVKKVVIPVAGLGTRGLPFTKEVPKELLPVIDTPCLQFIVEEVLAAGIEQVVFVTSKGKHALEDYFDPSPNLVTWLEKRGKRELAEKLDRIGKLVEVITVRQKEPLGLGHAVLCAAPVIGREKFAVCLGDEIYPPWNAAGKAPALRRLVTLSEEQRSSVVGVVEIPPQDSQSYGVIDLGGGAMSGGVAKVAKTVEKPKPADAPSRYAIIGRYVFENAVLDELREVKPGVGGEIQLTDGMDRLARSGRLQAMLVDDCRYDLGNHLFYVIAQVDAALRRPELADRLRAHLKERLA